MVRKHFYKHLDEQKNSNVTIAFNMKQIAEIVNDCNYGIHRLLSEIIDIKLKSKYKEDLEFAKELEKLLNKGYF